MKAWTVCALVMVLLLGASGSATAQGTRSREDWGSLGSIGSKYDLKTEVTLTGKIKALKRVPLGKRKGFYSLMLEVDDGTQVRNVYLGPTSYLRRKGYAFEAASPVELTGSNVTIKGKPLIIVRELKASGRIMRIRDKEGRHL